jgi:hypothetical protein
VNWPEENPAGLDPLAGGILETGDDERSVQPVMGANRGGDELDHDVGPGGCLAQALSLREHDLPAADRAALSSRNFYARSSMSVTIIAGERPPGAWTATAPERHRCCPRAMFNSS